MEKRKSFQRRSSWKTNDFKTFEWKIAKIKAVNWPRLARAFLSRQRILYGLPAGCESPVRRMGHEPPMAVRRPLEPTRQSRPDADFGLSHF